MYHFIKTKLLRLHISKRKTEESELDSFSHRIFHFRINIRTLRYISILESKIRITEILT